MSGSFKSGPKLMATLLVLVAIGAIAFLIHWSLSANMRPEGKTWFYDMKMRQLFAAYQSVPPIDTKSGPGMGVRAYVYTCDFTPKSTNRFVAYLEKFTPELKQAVEAELKQAGRQTPVGMLLERHPGGVLVSPPDLERWVPKFSEKGRQIMETGKRKGGCGNAVLCVP
jgi:hypothetical protein